MPQFGKICAMEYATKAGLCRRLSRRVNMIARKNPVKAPRNASVIERLLKVRSPWPVRRNPVYAMATVQRITRTENTGDSPLDEQILPQFALAELELLRSTVELLLTQIACSGGKYVVGVASDQPNGTDDHYQNHGQHHCVFSNVLAFLLRPELEEKMTHIDTPSEGLDLYISRTA
jgi:hypothetical protein